MYAIVREENGQFYTSAVFGYYDDNKDAKYSYGSYYIVLDKAKEKLIKKPLFNPEEMPYLVQMVLVTDGNHSDWELIDEYFGFVDFLPKDNAMKYIEHGLPEEIRQRCREYDARNPYREVQAIESDTDIDNLMWVSGYFHDAYIENITPISDGIKVLFKGTWGCSIEVCFEGNVAYCTDSRNPENYSPYWSDSTAFFDDGYVYLVDGEDMTAAEINDSYCWFKARKMSYRVIPD